MRFILLRFKQQHCKLRVLNLRRFGDAEDGSLCCWPGWMPQTLTVL